MSIDLSDIPVGDYTYGSLVYKDYRTLPADHFEQANELVKSVLVSVPMEFLCGDLVRMAILRREEQLGRFLSDEEEADLRARYAKVARSNAAQSVGSGMIRLAAVSGRKVVSVIQLQNSVLSLVNNDLVIKCTVALFNSGLRIWTDDATFNPNYVTALANLQAHLLANPIVLGNRKVIVNEINPIMPGGVYTTDVRLANYLTALDNAMFGKGVILVPVTSGNRAYNDYKL